MPPPDPREQRVQRVLRLPVPLDLQPTPESIHAARVQQRKDRAEAITEAGDEAFERSRDARLLIDALCDEFGSDRVHRWVRNACLIRGGVCPCEPVGRDGR